jgi:hypothetical protein
VKRSGNVPDNDSVSCTSWSDCIRSCSGLARDRGAGGKAEEYVELTADRERHWYKDIEEWVTLSAVFLVSVVTAVATGPGIAISGKLGSSLCIGWPEKGRS